MSNQGVPARATLHDMQRVSPTFDDDASDEPVRPAGLVVTVVGPDASGKTTLANALCRHFVHAGFEAQVLHLGQPRGSLGTRALRLALMIARKLLRLARGETSMDGVETRYPRLQAGLDLLLAQERLMLARRCQRLARDGVIVMADRYPSATAGSATGPRPLRGKSPVSQILWKVQCARYERVPRPNALVRLRVTVEEAIRRNAERPTPKEESAIRASHAAPEQEFIEGVPEMLLDATLTPSELVTEIVRTIGPLAAADRLQGLT